ncbi:unnamed protein product [Penicillium olsonii]|uniref:Zn(2)-C6 fungal-type domain-containing protein n=1 Tax=Penicillium olsonii TaxID=99116 RepID=A0A9W4HE95_PENOL|nr:unnamed protein product [Penicillium olsonii]
MDITPLRPQKQKRVSRACEACRSRKVKCNGEDPCETCWQNCTACSYRDYIRKRNKRSEQSNESSPDHPEDIPVRKRDRSTTTPARYCPREYRKQLEIRAGIGVANSKTGSFQFYGPSSHFCFIQRLYQRMKRQTHTALLGQSKSAIPDGLEKWGIERFMFATGSDTLHPLKCTTETFFSKEAGHRFIGAYFSIIHPHMPFLHRNSIEKHWESFWDAPDPDREIKWKSVVYMVISLGARTISRIDGGSVEALDKWAEYFWARSNNMDALFQEPSLKGIHLLLLKAMYAFHAMRVNDAYLYLGHAARTVLALGLNQSQVVNGCGENMHRLRITFWTVYYYERICAFYTGRPSGFSNNHIDVALPEDLTVAGPTPVDSNVNYSCPEINGAFLRAMSQIGKLIEVISSKVFSLANLQGLYNNIQVDVTLNECERSLSEISHKLPSYLQFYNRNRVIGHGWQEIQCTHLGLAFHLIRMMMHRPALVSSTFDSQPEAYDGTPDQITSIQRSIDISIESAKEMIEIASVAIFQRVREIRNDASVANYIVSACVTLLYNVTSSSVTSLYARMIFESVERGINCLDQMEHMGPTTGKALSVDLMKCAKDALVLSASSEDLEGDLVDSFPWLNDIFTPSEPDQPAASIDRPIDFFHELPGPVQHDISRNVDGFLSASISGVNHTYWLNGEFSGLDYLNPLD